MRRSENLLPQASHLFLRPIHLQPARCVLVSADLSPEVHFHAVFSILVARICGVWEKTASVLYLRLYSIHLQQVIHPHQSFDQSPIFIVLSRLLMS